jgi:hypothetical protein
MSQLHRGEDCKIRKYKIPVDSNTETHDNKITESYFVSIFSHCWILEGTDDPTALQERNKKPLYILQVMTWISGDRTRRMVTQSTPLYP